MKTLKNLEKIKIGCIVFLITLMLFIAYYLPKEITYINNGVEVNAIEYLNEIYLKKGE